MEILKNGLCITIPSHIPRVREKKYEGWISKMIWFKGEFHGYSTATDSRTAVEW